MSRTLPEECSLSSSIETGICGADATRSIHRIPSRLPQVRLCLSPMRGLMTAIGIMLAGQFRPRRGFGVSGRSSLLRDGLDQHRLLRPRQARVGDHRRRRPDLCFAHPAGIDREPTDLNRASRKHSEHCDRRTGRGRRPRLGEAPSALGIRKYRGDRRDRRREPGLRPLPGQPQERRQVGRIGSPRNGERRGTGEERRDLRLERLRNEARPHHPQGQDDQRLGDA